MRSELDSGLDTFWLLKKIVFLSAGGASSTETGRLKLQEAKTQVSAH